MSSTPPVRCRSPVRGFSESPRVTARDLLRSALNIPTESTTDPLLVYNQLMKDLREVDGRFSYFTLCLQDPTKESLELALRIGRSYSPVERAARLYHHAFKDTAEEFTMEMITTIRIVKMCTECYRKAIISFMNAGNQSVEDAFNQRFTQVLYQNYKALSQGRTNYVRKAIRCAKPFVDETSAAGVQDLSTRLIARFSERFPNVGVMTITSEALFQVLAESLSRAIDTCPHWYTNIVAHSDAAESTFKALLSETGSVCIARSWLMGLPLINTMMTLDDFLLPID